MTEKPDLPTTALSKNLSELFLRAFEKSPIFGSPSFKQKEKSPKKYINRGRPKKVTKIKIFPIPKPTMEGVKYE